MDLLKNAKVRLAALRASDQTAWDEVAYDEVDDEETNWDRNGARRCGVLTALQHDLRPEDHELVRALLAEEVTSHEESDFQGLDGSLRLGCYLLATYRDLADVGLQWRAKSANFHPQCCFYEHGLRGETRPGGVVCRR